jgi:hypothetical protein
MVDKKYLQTIVQAPKQVWETELELIWKAKVAYGNGVYEENTVFPGRYVSSY